MIRTLLPSLVIFALGPMPISEPKIGWAWWSIRDSVCSAGQVMFTNGTLYTCQNSAMIDYRPALRLRLKRSIIRAEHCEKWNNPGCLKYAGQPGASWGPAGHAIFWTMAHGEKALDQWILDHEHLTVRKMLTIYNGPEYAERVAGFERLNPELIIADALEVTNVGNR